MMADSVEHVISYWQLQSPPHIRGRVIGLYILSALGMRAFSGVTVGIVGGFIGIHWSLALSAMTLLAVVVGLLAFSTRAAPSGQKETVTVM
jgi:hypothetical protein